MTRLRLALVSLVALLGLSSCAALKDAMTAHVDVVARAGSQELHVDSVAALLGATDVPLRPDAIRSVAQLWVNYQLLAAAAADGDTLGTIEDADEGMWAAIAQLRFRKVFDVISKDWAKVDSSTFEQAYNEGALLGAAHILLSKKTEPGSEAANAAIKAEAERIAATVTSATFADVAKRRSDDPGSKERGGDYGVFPAGQMVPEFDAGIRSVPPGGITGVVETQFGYHIIRRHTYAEIKDQFGEAYQGIAAQRAESVYFAAMDSAAQVQVKESAPKLVKAIAEDPDAYRDSREAVATSRLADLTAGKLAKWMAAFPPQSRIRAQVLQAPDSQIPVFVQNVIRNEFLLRVADSLKVAPDSAELAQVRTAFLVGVVGVMEAIGVTPKALADSAPDAKGRAAVAARRANAFFAQVIRNEVQYVEVPDQVASVLRARYDNRVTPAGLDRALAAATKLRAAADSARAATQPPTAVPLPGAPVPPQQ